MFRGLETETLRQFHPTTALTFWTQKITAAPTLFLKSSIHCVNNSEIFSKGEADPDHLTDSQALLVKKSSLWGWAQS